MWKDGYTKTVSVKRKTAKSHIHQESSNGESNKTQKNTRKETGQKPTHVVTAMTYSDGIRGGSGGFFPPPSNTLILLRLSQNKQFLLQ